MAETVELLSFRRLGKYNENRKFEVMFAITTDTDGSCAIALPNDIMEFLDGRYGYTLTLAPGSPAPTDASDLEVKDENNLVLLGATRSGKDLVDSSETKIAYFEGPNGGDHYHLFNKENSLTFTITGNSVNSAVVNCKLQLVE